MPRNLEYINKMNQRAKNKIRLYVEAALCPNAVVELSPDDSHYLCNVMRLTEGHVLGCFNSTGEYECSIVEAHKKHCRIKVIGKVREAHAVPDIWLLFAPLKKDKTDFVIEKATELGVRTIVPIITRNTMSDKPRIERFIAQAKEASEQCERTDIPHIVKAETLEKILSSWPEESILFFMDESLQGADCVSVFSDFSKKAAAILVGPEGGFTSEEKKLLDSLPFVRGINLGPRILRAETAACAALAVWQAVVGDWIRGE